MVTNARLRRLILKGEQIFIKGLDSVDSTVVAYLMEDTSLPVLGALLWSNNHIMATFVVILLIVSKFG